MGDITTVDNIWGLAALLGTTLITGAFGLLMHNAKKSSDKKDVDVDQVVEKAEKAVNLQPVVDTLVREMAQQVAKMEQVEAEVAASRPIVKVKYPIALSHISAFHQLFPGSGLQIPEQIKDDL